jgi:hypothetical protein
MPKHTIRGAVVVMSALIAGGGLLAPGAAAATSPMINTVVGNGTQGSSGDTGVAINAELNGPTGVAEDSSGSLYIGDSNNNKVRKVVMPTTLNNDIIGTLAGTGAAGFSGDTGQATSAELRDPTFVAVDSKGNVYIADTGNNRIRVVSTSGIINTLAGSGDCASGNVGNGGPATSASLCSPTGLAVDPAGDLLISDSGHNAVREIPSVQACLSTLTCTIVGFAGSGMHGSKGDGSEARKAELDDPTGVVADSAGNVYIADTANCEVRVVTSGIIQRLTGNGKCTYSGDGGPAIKAQVNHPTGLGVDPSGDVFISDTNNERIRFVNLAKIITTYAGTGTAGFSGDCGPATAAEINTPTGQVAADGSAVYFSDTGNQRVRGIFNGPPPVLRPPPAAC